VRPDELVRVLPAVLALQTEPPVATLGVNSGRDIASERDRLHRFYDAALDAYRGQRERAARSLLQVTSEDPTNPYYAWFVVTDQQRAAAP
jgi:hypothetical protein